MKTLDEVIEAFARDEEYLCSACPLGEYCRGIEVSCYMVDALHYLMEYREKRDDILQMEEALGYCEIMDNPPLDWEQLKQMEGKPVWVVVDGKERWRIIREVTYEHLILESGLPLHKCWMNHPDGWQAYRKERE